MTELRYSSETTLDANDEQAYNELTETLRQAVLDEGTEMQTGRLRFDGNEIRVRFGLRMETNIENVGENKDSLAESLVDLGLEPDVETAEEKIQL